MQRVQDEDSAHEPYIRYVGKHEYNEILGGTLLGDDGNTGETYRFVICMTPAQSWQLLRADYIQCDIAFRRVVGYEEFEIGAWDFEKNISMCLRQWRRDNTHLTPQQSTSVVFS